MKLQDIIRTNKRYDVKAIAADVELTRQIQVILISLDLLEPPADGIFGSLSTAALHRFQTLTNCNEPGFLGAKTSQKLIETKPEDLTNPELILKVVQETVFKVKPIPSSQLSEVEKQGIKAGNAFSILAFEPVRNHVKVALRSQSFQGNSMWYVYQEHAEIYQGNNRVYPPIRPQRVRLDNFPYKAQTDNVYNPTGSCNVTSIAMCLTYYNAPRRRHYGQFEDELYEYALRRGYSRWSPYDLARIVKDYGAQDYFTQKGTLEDLKDWLAEGKPTVIHGYFTSFGHIMPVVGYDDYGLIVHDPFGEWFQTGYRTDLSGAYLRYSYSLIQQTCMPDGDFWVHFISK